MVYRHAPSDHRHSVQNMLPVHRKGPIRILVKGVRGASLSRLWPYLWIFYNHSHGDQSPNDHRYKTLIDGPTIHRSPFFALRAIHWSDCLAGTAIFLWVLTYYFSPFGNIVHHFFPTFSRDVTSVYSLAWVSRDVAPISFEREIQESNVPSSFLHVLWIQPFVPETTNFPSLPSFCFTTSPTRNPFLQCRICCMFANHQKSIQPRTLILCFPYHFIN